MLKIITLLLIIVLSVPGYVSADKRMPRKGLFVSVIQNPPVLYNAQTIRDLIRFSKNAGVDTLFVQIYRSNTCWFASKHGDDRPYRIAKEKVGEDPLLLLIREAHREGIEVHAWMNLLSLGENRDAFILRKHGVNILTRNRNAKKSLEDYKIDHQFFLEPGDPLVKKELVSLVEEVVQTYKALDGIQFDYIRYPDVHPAYGYTASNLERFRLASGLETFKENNRTWQEWKRIQVTELLRQLAASARSINPDIQVSATGCMPFARAFYEAFQDWPHWIDKDIIDFVTIMNYSTNFNEYDRWIRNAKTKTKHFNKVNVALGAYKETGSLAVFRKEYRNCQKSGARACVVFHYGSLLQNPEQTNFFLQSR